MSSPPSSARCSIIGSRADYNIWWILSHLFDDGLSRSLSSLARDSQPRQTERMIAGTRATLIARTEIEQPSTLREQRGYVVFTTLTFFAGMQTIFGGMVVCGDYKDQRVQQAN